MSYVEQAEPVVNAVRASVITRRTELLLCAGAKTPTEAQLIEIIRSLLIEVMDLEDYKRRVDFTMQCMEGDIKGFLGKVLAVRNGQPNQSGCGGFEPVPRDDLE